MYKKDGNVVIKKDRTLSSATITPMIIILLMTIASSIFIANPFNYINFSVDSSYIVGYIWVRELLIAINLCAIHFRVIRANIEK